MIIDLKMNKTYVWNSFGSFCFNESKSSSPECSDISGFLFKTFLQNGFIFIFLLLLKQTDSQQNRLI